MNAVVPAIRLQRVRREFEEHFGHPPRFMTRAPGRVDLMGSHTDYNMGFVLTLSIDRDTWLAVKPRDDSVVRLRSSGLRSGSAFSLEEITLDTQVPWTNYVRGVADILQKEGYVLHGFDGLVQSTVPIGSGLSSSAALEVSAAVAFRELGGWDIDPLRLALLCQRAENEFVGMNCGILDQYSSVMGESGYAMLLDCRKLRSDPVLVPQEVRIAICDTRAERELTGSEYPERRAQCEEGARLLGQRLPGVTALRDVSLDQFERHEIDLPQVVARRCRFIIEENERVLRLARVLPQGDRVAIAELAASSYQGARDLYEIGSPEMDAMFEAMMSAPGVIGARQAGAGFGGCMVAMVDAKKTDAFVNHVGGAYADLTGIEPAVFVTQAAPGAGLVELS
jgi:galactokinase